MITIKVRKKDGSYEEFISKGHAGYAEAGQDIVCAAVSALIITTVNSLEKFTVTSFDVKENDGFCFHSLDWRPGVDYRTVYSAHKAMGGGVTIDLIHEWDYLVELFGVPEQLYNFKGTYSDLEIDSDDLSVYIARYPTLLAEVHLDYFGRGYRRSIELFCHDGSYLADFGAGTLTLPDGTVQHYEEDVNRRYEREMEYFVDYALTGSGESCNPPALALNVLKLTLGENVQ